MVRQARSPQEIKTVKNKIIEEAMGLILEKGFNNMSLRNLAGRVKMSATNLYYYYSGKDEIYLNIQIRGFQLLEKKLNAVQEEGSNLHDTLERMFRAYLAFGFDHPDYYQIMLNSDSPRYLEYQGAGNAVAAVAFEAKQAAVRAIAVPLEIIRQILREKGEKSEKTVFIKGYQMWVSLHGIVTLNNRNILQELDEVVPAELIDHICSDLVRSL